MEIYIKYKAVFATINNYIILLEELGLDSLFITLDRKKPNDFCKLLGNEDLISYCNSIQFCFNLIQHFEKKIKLSQNKVFYTSLSRKKDIPNSSLNATTNERLKSLRPTRKSNIVSEAPQIPFISNKCNLVKSDSIKKIIESKIDDNAKRKRGRPKLKSSKLIIINPPIIQTKENQLSFITEPNIETNSNPVNCENNNKPDKIDINISEIKTKNTIPRVSMKSGLKQIALKLNDTGAFKCPKCTETCDDIKKFELHIKLHRIDLHYKCIVCKRRFRTEQHFLSHVHFTNRELQNNDEKSLNIFQYLKCDFCLDTFVNKESLIEHMNVHTSTNVPYNDDDTKTIVNSQTLNMSNGIHLNDSSILNIQNNDDNIPSTTNFNLFNDNNILIPNLDVFSENNILANNFNDFTNNIASNEYSGNIITNSEYACNIVTSNGYSANGALNNEHSRNIMNEYSGNIVSNIFLDYPNNILDKISERSDITYGNLIEFSNMPINNIIDYNDKLSLNDHTIKFINDNENCKINKSNQTINLKRESEKDSLIDEEKNGSSIKLIKQNQEIPITFNPGYTRVMIERKLSCSHCGKFFASIIDLQKHMMDHNYQSQLFECSHCPLTFKNPVYLRNHRYTHFQFFRYKCDKCDRKFKRRQGLHVHKAFHSDARPYKCEFCNKSFKQKQHWRAHNIQHEPTFAYQCSECGKSFKRSQSLRQHEYTHGDRIFPCKICGKKFAVPHNLRGHMEIHKKDRVFSCDVCGKVFKYIRTLTVHKRLHQGNLIPCLLCNKEFTRQADLKSHMVSHSVERPYLCNHCGQSFKCVYQKNRHVKRSCKNVPKNLDDTFYLA